MSNYEDRLFTIPQGCNIAMVDPVFQKPCKFISSFSRSMEHVLCEQAGTLFKFDHNNFEYTRIFSLDHSQFQAYHCDFASDGIIQKFTFI